MFQMTWRIFNNLTFCIVTVDSTTSWGVPVVLHHTELFCKGALDFVQILPLKVVNPCFVIYVIPLRALKQCRQGLSPALHPPVFRVIFPSLVIFPLSHFPFTFYPGNPAILRRRILDWYCDLGLTWNFSGFLVSGRKVFSRLALDKSAAYSAP